MYMFSKKTRRFYVSHYMTFYLSANDICPIMPLSQNFAYIVIEMFRITIFVRSSTREVKIILKNIRKLYFEKIILINKIPI